MSSLGKLMKQAARMQQQMQAVQAELAQRTVEATSGGGVVRATARCDGTLAALRIDPQAITPSDPALLEDLVLVAVNQALQRARETAAAEMSKVTGGAGLPGLL